MFRSVFFRHSFLQVISSDYCELVVARFQLFQLFLASASFRSRLAILSASPFCFARLNLAGVPPPHLSALRFSCVIGTQLAI